MHDANPIRDAVFVRIRAADDHRETQLVGITGATDLDERLRPVVIAPGAPQFNVEGFRYLRFIGWIVDGELVLDGPVPRPMKLWLCYNRLQQDTFSLALDADPSKDICTVVVSTVERGGVHFVRQSDADALWDLIEAAFPMAATTTTATLLTMVDPLDKFSATFLENYPDTTVPPATPDGGLVLLNMRDMMIHTQGSIARVPNDPVLRSCSAVASVARAGVNMRARLITGTANFRVTEKNVQAGDLMWATSIENEGNPKWQQETRPYGDTSRAQVTSVLTVFSRGVQPTPATAAQNAYYLLIGRVLAVNGADALGAKTVTVRILLGEN